MKKTVFLLLMIMTAGMLTAQTVSVGSVSGKVEVQEPGRLWKPASPGMVIPADSKISTGFASEATVVMDNADITVRPLTRMTLEEYSSSGDTTTTKLFLGSGRIRTDVKRSEGITNDFQVRSPVATAAVRGTSFEFDGVRLEVVEGNVDMFTGTGAKVNVPAGSGSEASEESGPVPPAAQKKRETRVSASTTTGEESVSVDAADEEENVFDPSADDAFNIFQELLNQSVTLTITIQ